METKEKDKGSRRQLANWLDSFLEYTDVLSSPRQFRLWAGISILASVMEQKVWARTKGATLFPNLYVILVGPPGVGKSAILSQSERMLRSVRELHVAPSSLTSASLIDTLAMSERKLVRPESTPSYVQFNSLIVIASELGVFLPAYDAAFMNTLTKMYDGELYEERRRTGKVNHIKIERPQLSVLGGTTPSYLNSFLPEGAWDQGFTSRTIFSYAGEPVEKDIWEEDKNHDKQEKAYIGVVNDLQHIGNLFGKMDWSDAVKAAITDWDRAGLPPVPEHGKLLHYNSRRLAHCLKLCMVASIARSDKLMVSLEDFEMARGWLLDAEATMPDIFRSFGVSADARAIEDAWYFVFKEYSKTKKPMLENQIVGFLANRVPSHQVTKIIDVMVKARALILDLSLGIPAYKPGARL